MTKNKVLWRKGGFWPGYSWRTLAHKRNDQGASKERSYLEEHEVALSSEDFEMPVEFDELVIDHWFHLEQMNDRDWWMRIGNWHINVHIDGNGNTSISSYENESEEDWAEYIERYRLNKPYVSPAVPLEMPPPPPMPQTSK